MKKLTYKIVSDNRTLIMGISIILIILFHYAQDCFRYSYHFSGLVKYYHDYIGSVGVDIFLMLSSFGLYYSFKKNNNLKQFFYKRYTRVLIPYLLVAIPTYIWICIEKGTSIFSFIKSVTFINLFHRKDYLFWYIFFICFCYLLFPILFNFIDSSKNKEEVSNKVINLCLVSTMICLLMYFFKRELFNDYNIMLLRFLPFFIGILMGYISFNKTKIGYSGYFMMIVGLFFVFFGNDKAMIGKYSSFYFVTSLLFIFIIILVKWLDKFKITIIFRKIIEWFGLYSLEIYLLHVALRNRFNSIGLSTCRVKYWLLYLAISLLLTPLLNLLVKKIQSLLDKRIKPLLD